MKRTGATIITMVLLLSLTSFAADIVKEEPVNRIQDTAEYIASQSYIFVFNENDVQGKADVKMRAEELVRQYNGELRHTYNTVLKGFSAKMSAEDAEELYAMNPSIKFYEKNGVAYICKKPVRPTDPPAEQTVPWGIARVNGGVSGATGTAWVIDTGVDLDNPDLNVDLSRCATFVARSKSADDDNGHGTHCAGTIAAIDNGIDVVGVAAGATVVAVKVLDRRGSGTWDGVLAGIDYVGANAQPGDVANMSLGGGASDAIDQAVYNAAQASGCIFCLAAGNESDDANNHSPARVNGPNIYTISAFGEGDVWAYFSNYGNPPVDYCEPGYNILSLKKGGGTTTMSGTSMATPHAAGIFLLGMGTDGHVLNDPDGHADPIGVVN